MKLDYRPEVDGLRAVAVLAVVIYHADIDIGGSTLLPGGYLGVDIWTSHANKDTLPVHFEAFSNASGLTPPR
jgi:hypothetical protein